jgi:hypothetical protein
MFDYNFVEDAASDDEFGAFVIDAATGLSAGPVFEFFTQDTSAGTITLNLSSLVGQTLGLQFQLAALLEDTNLDSVVTISNVKVEVAGAVIPEPSTLALLALSVLVIGGLQFHRKQA